MNEFRHMLDEMLRRHVKNIFFTIIIVFLRRYNSQSLFAPLFVKKKNILENKLKEKNIYEGKRCKKNVKIIDITLPFSSSATYFPTLIIYHIVGEEYSWTPNITPFL